MQGLKGLATGVGSLPHVDVEKALDLIFTTVPRLPFWPQLPKRSWREGMLAQFSEGLPCIKLNASGVFFDPREKDQELEQFYERIIAQDREYFKISPLFAQGLEAFYQRLKRADLQKIKQIKCQITGPFTFAASLKDEKGKALLHDPVLMQAIIDGLAMKAIWQIEYFREFAKHVIIFIDEPYLGCFGSAYTPLTREQVIQGLREITAQIKEVGGVSVGVHCCGNTDWSIFTEVETIDLISFDAFSYLDKILLYAQELEKFFAADRAFCWGIVPTQEFSGQETPDLLLTKISDGISALMKKGIAKNLLLKNLLLSPSCGLGALDEEKAIGIFQLLRDTANKLFDKII